jgi:hypothetical protein
MRTQYVSAFLKLTLEKFLHQTSSKDRISANSRYIEKLPSIAILQILNEYREIFQGSEGTDLFEVSVLFKVKLSEAIRGELYLFQF